jgi:hypothetical protein
MMVNRKVDLMVGNSVEAMVASLELILVEMMVDSKGYCVVVSSDYQLELSMVERWVDWKAALKVVL